MVEPSSSRAAAIWDVADRRISSRLLYPEARAALGAAQRAGRIDLEGLRGARLVLERLSTAVVYVELVPELARRAGDLAESHSLRGYDAVHLASVEAVAETGLVLAVADTRLAAAAETLGVTVARLP